MITDVGISAQVDSANGCHQATSRGQEGCACLSRLLRQTAARCSSARRHQPNVTNMQTNLKPPCARAVDWMCTDKLASGCRVQSIMLGCQPQSPTTLQRSQQSRSPQECLHCKFLFGSASVMSGCARHTYITYTVIYSVFLTRNERVQRSSSWVDCTLTVYRLLWPRHLIPAPYGQREAYAIQDYHASDLCRAG